MQMKTGNKQDDVRLDKEFQHHLTKEHRKNIVIDQGKKNDSLKENGQIDSILFRIMMMLYTNM